MKWFSTYDHPEKINAIIDYAGAAGYYLFLYFDSFADFEKDVRDPEFGCPNHNEDDLQDTLEIAQRIAWKDYGIPTNSWVSAAIYHAANRET